MEAAGFAISVLSLVSLCDTCVDLIERLQSFHRFEGEKSPLLNQLDANRLILQDWRHRTGISNNADPSARHITLDNKRSEIVYNLLLNLRDLLEAACRPGQGVRTRFAQGSATIPTQASNPRGSRSTTRLRDQFKWAFGGGKTKLQYQVQLSTDLIQKLRQLVPVEYGPDRTTGQQHVYDLSPGRSMFNGTDVTLFDLSRTATHKAGGLSWYSQHDLTTIRTSGTGPIRHWLQVVPFEGIYKKRLSERHIGTCCWLQRQSFFASWVSTNSSATTSQIIWLYGPGGCGKSVLCASTIEQLLDTNEEVGYFFCTSDGPYKDVAAIVVAFIWQLAMSNDTTLSNLVRWMEDMWPRQPSEDESWDFFERAITNANAPVLAIDGLDECQRSGTDWKDGQDSARTTFLNKLSHRTRDSRARIIVFSREEIDIREGITGFINNSYVLNTHRITTSDVESDLTLFAGTTVQSRLPSKPPEMQNTIIERLVHKSDGMFLWIKLQGTAFRDTKTRGQLLRMAEEMPYGLENLYIRNWDQIQKLPKYERKRAHSILMWLAFAIHPFTASQLTEAVALSAEDELPDLIDDDYVRNEILDPCGSLIVAEEVDGQLCGSSIVTFTHFSAKTFVLTTMSDASNPLSASCNEAVLAESCIRYLMNRSQWPALGSDDDTPPPSFLDYVVQNWHKHLTIQHPSSETTKLVNAFFSPANGSWLLWRDRYEALKKRILTDQSPYPFTPGGREYYSSLFNLVPTMVYIEQQQDYDWNREGGFLGTPLQAACALGLRQGVEFLLDRNVDVNQQGGAYGCALNAAAEKGDCETMLRLIVMGAGIKVKNYFGLTALHFAARKGHLEAVKLLLGRSADIDAVDYSNWTPLAFASQRGHVSVVELFLKYHANLNIADSTGTLPLAHAIRWEHTETAKLLLEQGASVNAPDNWGETPLMFAAYTGNIDVAELLLDRGADVNAVDCSRWTPLTFASRGERVNMIELLLDRGADIGVAEFSARAPLSHAALQGNLEAANLLLARGASVNTADDTGQTPLHYAIQCPQRCVEVIGLLLAHGADVYASLGNGETALCAASLRGDLGIVEILLQRVQLDLIQEPAYQVGPLRYAMQSDCPEVRDALIVHGFEVSAVDLAGRHALHSLIHVNHLSYLTALVNAADLVSRTDSLGCTVLHHLVRGSPVEIIQWAVDAGAELTQPDKQGWTPYHWAAYFGHVTAVDYLLQLGGLCQVLDAQGRSSGDIAMLMGHESVADLLSGTSKRYSPLQRTNAGCDHCDNEIRGQQYHCKTCVTEFDLCFRCNMDRDLLHPADHEFQEDFRY